jgi:hypothetical protein
MHYTPSYSSWINKVERWFAELTRQLIQRGDHRSVQALERDIRAWGRRLERQPQSLRLDQDRRTDPPVHPRINETNQWRGTLAVRA